MKHVYFMKPIGHDGPIKIGCSVLPAKRLRAVEIWSPIELELIGSVEGGHHEETSIHWMFGADRLHGEWFTATPRLLTFIEETLSAGRIPDWVHVPVGPREWAEAKEKAKGIRRRKRDLQGTVEPWRAQPSGKAA